MTAESLFQAEPRTLSLYEWQEEAVEALRANIRSGVKNQVLVAPTGAGKTVIATHLIEECFGKGKRAIFACDRIPLIEQTSDTFDDYGIPHGIIQADHWRTDSYHKIQVGSAQTLARRGWPDADLIIVDECHSLYRTTTERISRRDTITIGLTATPFAKGMGQFYDDVVTVRTLNQLTADGYLAPFEAYAAAEPDMEGVARDRYGEWAKDATAERAMPIIGDAVSEYLEKAMGKKFIAFGVNVKHCEELQRQFLEAGIKCDLYTHDRPGEARKAMIEEFKRPDGYLQGLISVAALAKGFDAPAVECIIMCRPLRSSLAEHIQILGRGLRRDPANPDKVCIVLDLSGNMLRFWQPMHDFFEHGATDLDDGKRRPKKKVEAKEREPFKCPKCASVHKPAPMCPHCGHQYPRRSMVEHLPGKLVALGSVVPESEGDLREDVFAQLLYHAKKQGYEKPGGWAAHRFEDLFGEGAFDREMFKLEPRPPTERTQSWITSQIIRWNRSRRRR